MLPSRIRTVLHPGNLFSLFSRRVGCSDFHVTNRPHTHQTYSAVLIRISSRSQTHHTYSAVLIRVGSHLQIICFPGVRTTIFSPWSLQQPWWCMGSNVCLGYLWSIHLYHQHILLSAFYVLGVILSAGYAKVSKTYKVPIFIDFILTK